MTARKCRTKASKPPVGRPAELGIQGHLDGWLSGGRDAEQREALAQPLTALVARVEVVRELVARGEWTELIDQLAAIQASAERLAAEVAVARRGLDGRPPEGT